MSLGEYIPNSNTKLLLHLNGNSTDSSGNGNNGTDSNITYSQANGKFGQGAGVNGSSSKIVSTTAIGDTALASKTLVTWVKIGVDFTYPDGNKGTVVEIKYNTRIFRIHFFRQTFNKLAGSLFRTNIGDYMLTSTFAVTAAAGWYNCILTFNGTTLSFYVNGSLIGTSNPNSSPGEIDKGVGYSLGVFSGAYSTSSEYFNGSIDEVIVENVAWSAEKVKKYFTMTKGRFGIL